MNEIKINMLSGIPMVYMRIWSRTQNVYRWLLLTLDTGAAITTISKDILYTLGYDVQTKEKKRITTASGIEYVDEVMLDKIMLAGFELTNITSYAHTFPQESFSNGVIGINVLSNFDIFISLQNKILKLSPVNERV